MRVFARTVLLIAAAAAGACSMVPSECTLIGCEDGLSVEPSGLPAGSEYRLDLLLPSGEVVTRECPGGPWCGTTAFFPGVTADELTVRVTTARGVRETAVRPAYTRTRPNGPGCEPVCRQARVTVPVPD